MRATEERNKPVDGRDVARRLSETGALDGLFEQIDSGEARDDRGPGAAPRSAPRRFRGRGLRAELTEHLGYEKGEPTTSARGNARNGTTTKTIDSEVGPFETRGAPRDRAGSFTPRLVRKGQRRMDGLDAMIIGLYAGGMTAREIRHHLESTIGVDLSRGTISKVTDAVCDAVMEWQRRPPGGLLPGDLPRRDPRQGPRRPPGVEPLGPHRRGRGHGRRQARGLRIWIQDGEGASLKGAACAPIWPTGAC